MSNKQIVKNSVILYIRLLVTTIFGIFTSRFVLKALGASDFGLYNVVAGVVTMMAFINNMMVTTTYRFIAVEMGKEDGEVNGVFNTSLMIHVAVSIIVALLAFTVGLFYIINYLVVPEGKLSDAVFVFSFAILNTICVILSTPFHGLLVAKEKFSVTVPIEVLTKLLIMCSVILLLILPGNKLRLYAVFITFAHMMNPILYVLYCMKNYKSEIRLRFQHNRQRYKDMIAFSGWIMIGAGAKMGEHQGSAIILNRFFGTILNASFGIASQVNTMVRMFSSSLGQAVIPQITKSYSANNHIRSKQLVVFSSKYSFFLMLMPLLPILVETDYIMHVWLSSVPQYTVIFVQIMLIKSLLVALQSGIPTLIQASGKMRLFTIFSGIALLSCLPLAYIAFSLGFPPYVISHIFLVSSALSFIVTLVLLKLVLNYDLGFFLKRVLLKALVVLLWVAPAFLIPLFMKQGFLRLLASLVISELLLFSSVYLFGMEARERQMLKDYLVHGVCVMKAWFQTA